MPPLVSGCSTRGWRRRLTLSAAVRRYAEKDELKYRRVQEAARRHGERLPRWLRENDRFSTDVGPFTLESICWPSGRMTHHLEFSDERSPRG